MSHLYIALRTKVFNKAHWAIGKIIYYLGFSYLFFTNISVVIVSPYLSYHSFWV